MGRAEVRILLAALLLQLRGGEVTGRLFFAHDTYKTLVTTEHPVDSPLISARVFNASLIDSAYNCNTEGTASNKFNVKINGTLVQLFTKRPLVLEEGQDETEYQLFIVCGHHHQAKRCKTNVTVTVLSVATAQQVSPYTRSPPVVHEICFSGFPDHLYIRENSTGFVATEITGSMLDGRGRFTRNYSLEPTSGNSLFPQRLDESGRLWITHPLDYETHSEVNATVTCNVIDDTGYQGYAKQDVKVHVVNINDMMPFVQSLESRGPIEVGPKKFTKVTKGEFIEYFILEDKDGAEFIHELDAFIQGDQYDQFYLESKLLTFGSSYNQITIKWAKAPMPPRPSYNFDLVYWDKGYTANFGKNQTEEKVIPVRLTLEIPWYIKSTAQNYSRVPGNLYEEGYVDYKVTEIHGAPANTFAVTPNEAILYVNDSRHLANATDRIITVDYEFEDRGYLLTKSLNITVIAAGSPNAMLDDAQCGVPCSYHRTATECSRSCGPGTGAVSNSCYWRNQCNSSSIKHSLKEVCYCSPHTDTCPDKHCDELEQLDPSLCPVDCPRGKDVIEAYYRMKGSLDNVHFWCDSKECHCAQELDLSDKLVNASKKPQDNNRSTSPTMMPTTTVAPSCGSLCMALALGGSAVMGFVLVLMVLLARRSCRPQPDKTTPEKPLNGSVASLSATPSDYVVDTGDQQQTRISSAVSQNSLDWLTRGMGPPVSIDRKWEFPRRNLQLEKTLGEGEFGRVVRAQAYELAGADQYSTVAIKMLKECATGSELRDLLSEYNLLKDVAHVNVIKLLGVCSKGGPFFVIVEYCEHGALRSFLRNCRLNESLDNEPIHVTSPRPTNESETDSTDPDHSITANDLLSFAWQIAKGMQYLSTMKLVHRDLAARNVLVATSKVIKISDFGLSRDIYEEDTYMKRSKGRIPVKWMAPESLYEQVYTTKSDVWSFGITLWEIVTLGATPYPGLAPERLYHRLKSGYRMEKPTHCSDQLFRVISWCWRTLPGDRPTFAQLVDTLESMLKQHVEYLDLGGALDRHPILDDDAVDPEDDVSDQEGGYGSISRLTEDNAYLNPASHGHHNFDDVVCDDCTMRMIKEGDVTTECTKLLSHGENGDCMNNTNSSSTNNKANNSRPLLYIQVEHDQSDEEAEGVSSNPPVAV